MERMAQLNNHTCMKRETIQAWRKKMRMWVMMLTDWVSKDKKENRMLHTSDLMTE